MTYGVWTSPALEIAESAYWALVFYRQEPTIGAELYNGFQEAKTLAAVCEHDLNDHKTVYAYEGPGGRRWTNDFRGVRQKLGLPLSYDRAGLRQIDDIHPSQPFELPTVTEAGIRQCLLLWRMGCAYRCFEGGMLFTMVTGKIEYVFSVQQEKCNLYCGASVNVPTDQGMLGQGQYFRLRSYDDNTAPFCGFHSQLGGDAEWKETAPIRCESGVCTATDQGLYWPLKRCTDDEIILSGCGGDEYIYRRSDAKSEYFQWSGCRD